MLAERDFLDLKFKPSGRDSFMWSLQQTAGLLYALAPGHEAEVVALLVMLLVHKAVQSYRSSMFRVCYFSSQNEQNKMDGKSSKLFKFEDRKFR